MLACWSRDCEERPSFQSLSKQLFDMQKRERPYVNVDPSQDLTLPPTTGQGVENMMFQQFILTFIRPLLIYSFAYSLQFMHPLILLFSFSCLCPYLHLHRKI